jgi:PAS domain S-box-containing protein
MENTPDVVALRRAEARFRGLLESAPDGIVVVDRGGTIVIVNSQTERMFGYSRDELIGNKIELLVPLGSREHHGRDRAAYAADPRTRPMGAGRALTGRAKNGSEFPVEISLSPLVTDQESLVMSIVRDITDRRRAEELIQASLREKEALLREIHHRVKNNLQITSSLLRLQAGAIENPEARQVFAETQHRIRSMALVHEKLYGSTNLSQIDFGDYIRTLGDLLFKSFAVDPSRIRLTVIDEEVLLSIDTAVPCGLIVNELLLNALKHAFPDDARGEIVVELADGGDGWCRMAVRDDGIGLPDDAAHDSAGTLGLQLVRGLVAQLDGQLSVEYGRGGAGFGIRFRKERSAHG